MFSLYTGFKGFTLLPFLVLAFLLSACAGGWANSSPAGLEAKVNTVLVPYAESLAALPSVVKAVKQANAAQKTKMDNAKWKLLPVNSPLVQELQKNAAALSLQKKRAAYVSEIFVNAADGSKVAFLEKTTFWNHANAIKHKIPMLGKTWVGEIQLDDSSGANQLQVSVPVKEGEKVIGSLVVGAAIAKL